MTWLVPVSNNPQASTKSFAICRTEIIASESKKSPMTTEIFLKSFQSLHGFLVDTRFMDMALLAHAGFLRLDTLSNLRLKDITPDPAYFELFIESSKTDQYVRMSLYHVVKTGADLCRWANLFNYSSQPKSILPTSLMVGMTSCLGIYKRNPEPILSASVPRFHAPHVVKFCQNI